MIGARDGLSLGSFSVCLSEEGKTTSLDVLCRSGCRIDDMVLSLTSSFFL